MTIVTSPLPVTVRELARRIIATSAPLLGGNVWEAAAAPTPEEIAGEPFCIVSFGPQPIVNTWGARAWPMTVIVEVPRSNPNASYRYIDQINAQIVDAFNNPANRVLDETPLLNMTQASTTPGDLGARYVVDYAGDVQNDGIDEGFDALIRPIQFSLGALNLQPEDQHKVLVALRHWFSQTFPQAQVETQLFNPTNLDPSIGVRFERGELVQDVMTDEIRWIDALVACHVIAPDNMVRAQWVQTIASALRVDMLARGKSIALPTSVGPPPVFASTLEQSPKLTVALQRNNPLADAFTEGQLTLLCRWLEVDVDQLTQTEPVVTEVIMDAPITAQVGPVP